MVVNTKELFATVDRMDPEEFASFFTEDGLFRFGNAPAVKGRGEVAEAVGQFFASIKALRHTIIGQWSSEGVDIAEVEVTYTRHDGSQVDLAAACVFRLEGDLISDYRIYMDINPLYAEAPPA